MIDLDREMRALLEEEARRTPPLPEAAATLRRVRRRQTVVVLTGLVVMLGMAIGSVAGVSALVRSSERRVPMVPDQAPFTCPDDANPDRPGPVTQPRPSGKDYVYAQTAFDRGSGQVVMLTAQGEMWTFDVCTNTWRDEPSSRDLGGVRELVYDVDSDRMIALVGAVWVDDGVDGSWVQRGGAPLSFASAFSQGSEAVYDPVTGLVVVWDGSASSMWTYDVDTDTWREVEQEGPLPPTLDWKRGWDAELLTYDASVDRLVLYVGGESGHRTWEFDLRAGWWVERQADTPATGFGWIPSGDETAYDEVNEVSVLFSGGTTATYDASAARWDVLTGGKGVAAAPDGRMTRLYFAMTYDSVNGRVVVAGGDFRMTDRWHTTDEVMAFDVATGEWTQLLAPSGDGG